MKYIIKIAIAILPLPLISCTAKTPEAKMPQLKLSDTIPVAVSTESREEIAFLGYWTPVSYRFGAISALDSAQTEELMKKKVYLGKDIAVMFGDTLYSPTYYTPEKVNAEMWALDMRETKNRLGITTDSIFTVEMRFKMRSGNSSFREFAFDGEKLLMCPDGPYIWLTREKLKNKYSGVGNATKEMHLTGKETSLQLFYKFFSDPDELSVYDQNGKELYHSGVKSTKEEEKAIIKLNNTTRLTFKLNSKITNSRWEFAVEAR